MDVSCVVIELKPNSLDRVKAWASYILNNKEEALLTLQNEKVSVENFFFINLDSKDYLVGYMRAKSMEYAHKVVQKSISELDAYHQQFKQECWVNAKPANLVLELNRLVDEEASL